jgi:periplasmic divalent cation tolerance protein
MPTRFAVALSTAPNVEKASEIARTLVQEGIVACVNIVPGVRSIYFWDGELCDGAEVLCVMKTRADRIDALRERLPALHPYEVPELIVLDVADGLEAYLSWVDASCH